MEPFYSRHLYFILRHARRSNWLTLSSPDSKIQDSTSTKAHPAFLVHSHIRWFSTRFLLSLTSVSNRTIRMTISVFPDKKPKNKIWYDHVRSNEIRMKNHGSSRLMISYAIRLMYDRDLLEDRTWILSCDLERNIRSCALSVQTARSNSILDYLTVSVFDLDTFHFQNRPKFAFFVYTLL